MDMEKRRIEFDGKWVEVIRDDGWGEPPTWFLDFDDGRKLRVDYALEDTQLSVVQRLIQLNNNHSLDKYLIELVDTDWLCVGREDDVEMIILSYFDYDEASQKRDYASLFELNEWIAKSVTGLGGFAQDEVDGLARDEEGCTSHDFLGLVGFKEVFDVNFKNLVSSVETYIKDFETVQNRIVFSGRIFAGEKVGLGWSNESFFAQYGDTAEAAQLRALAGL